MTFPLPSLRSWTKALRPHQWVLLFIPAVPMHTMMHPSVIGTALLAFIAFGLCASSVYVLNDLSDLTSDRSVLKRHLPFAAGVLSVGSSLMAASLLLTGRSSAQ